MLRKKRIGQVNDKILVSGSEALLDDKEILVSEDDGYTILRKRVNNKIATYIVVPLEEFYPPQAPLMLNDEQPIEEQPLEVEPVTVETNGLQEET